MNIKDPIIDTVMYISPYDRPRNVQENAENCFQKHGKKKRVYIQNAGFESIN